MEEMKQSDADVLKAIEVVKAHLREGWIAEGCETEHAFGCASCQAAALSRQLDSLKAWIVEDGSPVAALSEPQP